MRDLTFYAALLHGASFIPCGASQPGRISFLSALRLLLVSWWSNLVGCLLMVGLFDGARVWPGRDHYLTHLAEAKCSLEWGTVVVRGEWADGAGAEHGSSC